VAVDKISTRQGKLAQEMGRCHEIHSARREIGVREYLREENRDEVATRKMKLKKSYELEQEK
jgi:hypothetical protein